MATQIQIRRDTGGNWYGNNTVLASGELAYETDHKRLKIGDGTTSYNSIDYIHDPTVTVYLEKIEKLSSNVNINDTGTNANIAVAVAGTEELSVSESGLKLKTGGRVNSILDEDTLSTDSDTALATQQSIKAYVDSGVAPSIKVLSSNVSVYDVGTNANVSVGVAGTQELNISEYGIALSNGVRVDRILDEDDFASDSDGALATQQSIKAYLATKGGISPWQVKTANYTAVAGDRLLVDTYTPSSGLTITLPASASMGDQIEIVDGGHDASNYAITIARNSHKINSGTDNLSIVTNGASFVLVYVGVDVGWTSMYRTTEGSTS